MEQVKSHVKISWNLESDCYIVFESESPGEERVMKIKEETHCGEEMKDWGTRKE